MMTFFIQQSCQVLFPINPMIIFVKVTPHHYIQMSQKYKSNTINIGPTQEAPKRDCKWYIPSPRVWSITGFTSDILVHSSKFKPIDQFLLIKGSSPSLKQFIWNMEFWKANKKIWNSMNLMWVVWLKPGKLTIRSDHSPCQVTR